ncbi:unnamed protein product, partial [Brugia timori]
MDSLINSSYALSHPVLKPEAWQTWGIGMVIVTISAFASPSCILFVPLLNKKLYERVMTFLVAVGIGALSGSVAFEVPEREGLIKSLIILGSLYAFFAVDRILKFAMEIKRQRKSRELMKTDKTNKRDLEMTLPKPGSHKNFHNKDEIEQIQAEIESAAVNSAITRTFSTRKKVPVIMHVEDTRGDTDNNNSLQVPQPIATIYSTSPTLSQRRRNQVREGDKISVSVAVVEQIEVRPETLEIS